MAGPRLDARHLSAALVSSPLPSGSPRESLDHVRNVEFADTNARNSFEMAETRLNSSASSVHQSKEDLEHQHGGHAIDPYDPNRPKLGLRQRLHHFTWAWYTLTMSTGGLSLLIFSQPFQFNGLKEIGLFFYVLNIIMLVSVTGLMVTRFMLHRGDFSASLTHPRESLFFPTFFLSMATLITSTERYTVGENEEQLLWAVQLAFWAYVVLTLMVAVGQYSYLFAKLEYGLNTMMPTWILPIFPIMLSGTIASVIAEKQPSEQALPIVIGGLACQGLGISVSFMMYAHMIGRLMSSGLPNREHRPGLFMNVGPPAFTALALIGMANGLPDNFDVEQDGSPDANMIRIMAILVAVFLWALALWWFCIAFIAVVASPPQYFHLGWWAMVFPNTGFILATINIGNEIQSDGVLWFTTGLSICLFLMYCFVLGSQIKAVIKQEIMYPGRDEDVNDH